MRPRSPVSARASRGLVRSRLTAASASRRDRAARSSRAAPDRTTSATATPPSAGGRTPRQRPGDDRAVTTETNATFEKRGTATASPATREPPEDSRQSTSRPTSPPIQIEPEARCSQSKSSDQPRGAVCAACPAAPGMSSAAARGEHSADSREQLGQRPPLAFGPVDPDRERRPRRRKARSTIHEIDEPAPERRDAHERDERIRLRTPSAARSPPSPAAGRPGSRRARRQQLTANATVTARRLVPPTRRTTGRAIASRNAARPIATITERKTTHRAVTSLRCRGGLGGRRDHELRRGARVRADGKGERSSYGVPVDGDRPPVDEVPPLRITLAAAPAACRGPPANAAAALSSPGYRRRR